MCVQSKGVQNASFIDLKCQRFTELRLFATPPPTTPPTISSISK
jgi:hypothetical protein